MSRLKSVCDDMNLRDRDVLRVLLRDLDEFPDLLAEVWS